MALRLVSLDLDGTLIHPAIFNAVADALGFGEPLAWSYQEYVAGRMSLEEAFRHDYKFFVGRSVEEMHEALRESKAWTPGIAEAVAAMKAAGLRVIVTTDQPDFLAETTLDFFGVDDVVCSPAEVRHGRVTASVFPEFEKWPNLERYLRARKVDASHVAHVGNGTNDVPVFERVGFSLAVNALHPSVVQAADASIDRVRDFREVAAALLPRAS